MQIIHSIIIRVYLLTYTIFSFSAESPAIPRSFHIVHPPHYLYNSIPLHLRGKATYYRALLEQAHPDEHSCGQRTIYHALALERAMAEIKGGTPLHVSLRRLLANERLYKSMDTKINSMIQSEEPLCDISEGTRGDQLARAGDLFPALRNKILPIYLKNNKLKMIDTGTHSVLSLAGIKAIPQDDISYKNLWDADEFFLQLSKLKCFLDTIHFPALLDNQHWVLASVMLNYKSKPQLLVFDSCNQMMHDYPSFQLLIRLLHRELQKL